MPRHHIKNSPVEKIDGHTIKKHEIEGNVVTIDCMGDNFEGLYVIAKVIGKDVQYWTSLNDRDAMGTFNYDEIAPVIEYEHTDFIFNAADLVKFLRTNYPQLLIS